MKKIHIYSFPVESKFPKQYFQIRLPLNTKRIKGIYVGVESFQQRIELVNFDLGNLTLWLSENQLFFFNEVVKANNIFNSSVNVNPKSAPPTSLTQIMLYDIIGYNPKFQPIMQPTAGTPWFSSKKEEFFSLDLETENRIVEGFYEGVFSSFNTNYTLKIYLILEV